MNYSNWGPPGLGPSMLSHNSCYWIQSNSGLWRPGTCTNITMGVVCKLPRGERPAPLPPAPAKLAPGWGQPPILILWRTQCTGRRGQTGLGLPGPSPGVNGSVGRTGSSYRFPSYTADPSLAVVKSMDGGQASAKPLTSSVILGKLLKLCGLSFLICKMGMITVPTRLNELIKCLAFRRCLYVCILLSLLLLLLLTGPSFFPAAEESRFSPSGEWKAGFSLLCPLFRARGGGPLGLLDRVSVLPQQRSQTALRPWWWC